jgi:hypothetical protein
MRDYLRNCGAAVHVHPVNEAAPDEPCACGMLGHARSSASRTRDELELHARKSGDHPGLDGLSDDVDAGVLSLRRPHPVASELQAAEIPFVIFGDDAPAIDPLYSHGDEVQAADGYELLALALLFNVALHGSGLLATPEARLRDTMPQLRELARGLVHDAEVADELLASAMEQTVVAASGRSASTDVSSLLVATIKRNWLQKRPPRLN